METLIKKHFKKYTIIRLGNISFGKNPNTIINFLRDRIKKGLPLKIQDTYRYVTDKEEFLHYINLIPDWSCEMTLFGRRMKVAEIVKEIKAGKL